MSVKVQNLQPQYHESAAYWRDQFSSNLKDLWLPYEGTISMDGITSVEFSLEPELRDAITQVCKNQDLLLYTFLCSVFQIFLYKLTGNSDVYMMSPVYHSSSPSPDCKHAVIVRNNIQENFTFRDMLSAVRKSLINAYLHQQYPFESILELHHDSIHIPIFKTGLVLDSIHHPESFLEMAHQYGNHFVMTFHKDSALQVTITYNPQNIRNEDICTIWKTYINILKQSVNGIDMMISDFQLVTETESRLLLCDYNASEKACAETIPTIYGLFQKICARHGNRTAITVTAKNVIEQLTYDELNFRSSRLAYDLRQQGVQPGDIVGILFPSSLNLIIAMLGVMKAGATYLSLDYDHPPERNNNLLNESSAVFLLTDTTQAPVYSYPKKMYLDELNLLEGEITIPPFDLPEDANAYVIYTSGSTGKPKGICVQHRHLIHFARWRIEEFRYSSEDVTLQLMSCAFDAFVANMYPTLLSGGNLVMVERAWNKDFYYIKEILPELKITNFSVVPSMYGLILNHCDASDLQKVRLVILGGESPTRELIEQSRNTQQNHIARDPLGIWLVVGTLYFTCLVRRW